MSIRIKQLVKNRQLAFTQGDLVKWRFLRNNNKITKAKTNFYKNSICSLKNSQPAQWHRLLFKISATSNPSRVLFLELRLIQVKQLKPPIGILQQFAINSQLQLLKIFLRTVLTGRSTASKDLSRAGAKSSEKSTII